MVSFFLNNYFLINLYHFCPPFLVFSCFELKLITFSSSSLQNPLADMPRIVFQCVNVDTIRILSIRLEDSRERHFFSRAAQSPSYHPQPVQNLIHARRGNIHSVPIDVAGVGLGPEIISMYWNSRARQFIFRGVELLAERAELDWFASAPARRQAAIARRLETRRRNLQARRQAIADRIREAENRILQPPLPNALAPNNLPNNNNRPPVEHGQNDQQPPPRRPGLSRSNSAIRNERMMPNNIIPATADQHQQVPSNRQPDRNVPLNPRIIQIANSTPILHRVPRNPPIQPNDQNEVSTVGSRTLANLFGNESLANPQAIPNPVSERVEEEVPNIQAVLPEEVAGPSGLQANDGPPSPSVDDVAHSVSSMDVELADDSRRQAAFNNENQRRKRVRRNDPSTGSST